MAKTNSIPKPKAIAPRASKTRPAESPKLSKEQQVRLAAFDAFVKKGRAEWEAMTPKERAEEDAKWDKVKATINADRAGYRQVFVDE